MTSATEGTTVTAKQATPAVILGDLQEVLQDLSEIQDELMAVPKLSFEEIVDTGMVLWEIHRHITKIMAPLKTLLRAEAEKSQDGEPGPVEFHGSQDDKIIVVIQAKKPRLRKGADMRDLHLRDDISDYFTAKFRYTPVEDFVDRANDADPETMTVLHDLVEIRQDQPRVTFKPNKEYKP
jgi:hypothetical protein